MALAETAPDTEPSPLLTNLSAKGILRVVLNRPQRRNSLSEEMLAALQQCLDDAAEDANVRVIILAANGPAFSAGHDLKEVTAHRTDPDRGRAYFGLLMSKCSKVMQSVVRHPKPIIAEVAGIATAAGCQLAASCDLVVAGESARFSTPGVNIGLFCSTPMVALSRSVSRKHAMEMLLTGEMMSAAQAQAFGLVNRVADDDALPAAANSLAETIAAKSSHTLKIGKEAFYRQAEMSLEEAYDYCSDVMVENMLAHDAEEGIGAFIEKRAPVWNDA